MLVLALHPVAAKIAELLEPHIERQGYELVAVEYHKGTRSSLVRLLVDKPGGGIGLDDLEKLSPVLSDLLDVYDPVTERYTLEVASPGVNRPLSKFEHFAAVRGGRVKVRTHQARDGQRTFTGRLAELSEAGIELDDEISHRRVAIGFGEMARANFEYDFDEHKKKA
ncbi:MAG TPA: ribosome maturation factor RimP [Candidatus Binataceae bacterium]|nr:ribosome maturation factor RimP [Candidatus Binataceae bacterium]